MTDVWAADGESIGPRINCRIADVTKRRHFRRTVNVLFRVGRVGLDHDEGKGRTAAGRNEGEPRKTHQLYQCGWSSFGLMSGKVARLLAMAAHPPPSTMRRTPISKRNPPSLNAASWR